MQLQTNTVTHTTISMASLSVEQIIMDAQRMADRVRDLDTLSSALLVEAEGNNRFVESLRQFQDDLESLNEIANSKTNAEMVNRIQQQNASSLEILKENRELKICIEDYERAMELIMQKYREHTKSKVLSSKIDFKDIYNEKLWNIIRDQRQKINEMAAVMQKAAAVDDTCDLEDLTKLRLENQSLRELLQISKQYGTYSQPIRFNEYLLNEKAVQTDEVVESLNDALSESSSCSVESRADNMRYLSIEVETNSMSKNNLLKETSFVLPEAETTINSNNSSNSNNSNESNISINCNNNIDNYHDSSISSDSMKFTKDCISSKTSTTLATDVDQATQIENDKNDNFINSTHENEYKTTKSNKFDYGSNLNNILIEENVPFLNNETIISEVIPELLNNVSIESPNDECSMETSLSNETLKEDLSDETGVENKVMFDNKLPMVVNNGSSLT